MSLESSDYIILDRYVEIQFFIYGLQGISSVYSDQILSTVPKSYLNFFINVNPEDSYPRICSRRKDIKDHESFDNRLLAYDYYSNNIGRFNLTPVDGSLNINVIQFEIRKIFEEKTIGFHII